MIVSNVTPVNHETKVFWTKSCVLVFKWFNNYLVCVYDQLVVLGCVAIFNRGQASDPLVNKITARQHARNVAFSKLHLVSQQFFGF